MTATTTKANRDPYRTTFHRNGEVTLWDVWRQTWERTRTPSDEQIAALSPDERWRVRLHTGGMR